MDYEFKAEDIRNMTDKNMKFLLKAALVVVALALGFSLNMLKFRSPFTSAGPTQVASQEGSSRPDPRLEQPASKPDGQASPPELEGKRESSAATGDQGAASRDSKQAPADSQADSATSDTLPAASEAAVPKTNSKELQPAERGLSEQAGKESPVSLAKDASKQAAVYVVQNESGSEVSPGAPKVLSDEKAAHAAKIGRQIPADAQAAKSANVPAKNGARELTAAKPEKGKQRMEQVDVADQNAGKAKEKEKPGKNAASDVDGQAGQTATESKEAKSGKPGKNKPGAQENTLSQSSGQQTSSETESQRGQTEKSAAAKGGRVVDVTAKDNPGEFVLTITTDGPVERVTSFHAKDPARLAVDIWGGWQTSVPGVIAVGGPLMERIRIGSHPDKLRLVVDYRDKDSSGFSDPVVEKKDKSVVIRVPKNKKPQ